MLGSLLVETPDGRRTYKHYGTTRNGIPRFTSFLRVRADHCAARGRGETACRRMGSGVP